MLVCQKADHKFSHHTAKLNTALLLEGHMTQGTTSSYGVTVSAYRGEINYCSMSPRATVRVERCIQSS